MPKLQPGLFMISGPNGEPIGDNQVIVVKDKLNDCFRFLDKWGRAFYTDGFENLKVYGILDIDKSVLKPYLGEPKNDSVE